MADDAILIVLDRDGVLNRMVPNPAEPRPDSPLRASEVQVFPWVAPAVRQLTEAGFGIVIASNQPAWAKGKTTRQDLEAVHEIICAEAASTGGVILGSYICYHRAEDGCACRKPRTGLLAEAFARHPVYRPAASWMVGDRATDVLAGAAFGMNTAYLGDADGAGVADLADFASLAQHEVQPSFCGTDLRDFVAFILGNSR